MTNIKKNIAVIVASGKGTRFESKIPKQFLLLNNREIINHSVGKFINHKLVDLVVLVLNKKHKKYFNKIVKYPNLIYAFGGDRRQDSVLMGLKKIKRYKPKNVLIHDANRPFIKKNLITKIIINLNRKYPAIVPVIKIKETIKYIKKNVSSIIDRNKSFMIQTPQGFDFKKLHALHLKFKSETFTDDSSLFELNKEKIKFVDGNNDNIKITDKNDLIIGEKLYNSNNTMINKNTNLIGMGIDFHKFKNQKGKLILCGVKIPFNKSLIAHSDGDLGYHALSDGILGAISEGDIGKHFPDSNKKNKNLNSATILKHCYNLMKKKINSEIKNVDLTFIGEEPKILKYEKKMKKNISKILKIDLNQINIKATTSEKMGSLGRKEGLGAFALVNIN